MNRAQRRANVRSARTEARSMGCECTPTIRGATPERIQAVGAVDGLMIRHQRGCPLGEAAYQLNLIGIVPDYWTTTTRCGR